jgi:hypothetical protein
MVAYYHHGLFQHFWRFNNQAVGDGGLLHTLYCNIALHPAERLLPASQVLDIEVRAFDLPVRQLIIT